MIVKTFILGSLENNNYLFFDEESKNAALIDCTQPNKEIYDEIDNLGANLKYILLTHAHFDHVLGVNSFKEKYPNAKVLLHEDDKKLLDGIKDFAKAYSLGDVEVQKVDKYFKDGEEIDFGRKKIKTIHTPGHTKGGACFLVGDKIFTGDTLFCECVGRTDLPGGSFEQIKSSIESKLFVLDDTITVYSGHGPTTTIGHEKTNNKCL